MSDRTDLVHLHALQPEYRRVEHAASTGLKAHPHSADLTDLHDWAAELVRATEGEGAFKIPKGDAAVDEVFRLARRAAEICEKYGLLHSLVD